MYTKSIIQQELERYNIQESFRNGLENLMDKYNIEDSVFMNVNGSVKESVRGYYVELNEHESLKEALSDFGYAVRIQNNEKFSTGVVYESLSQCPEDKKVLDLDTLRYVRE